MISYGRHSISQDDIDAVSEVLRSDWLTTGPLVEKFEAELQKVVGAPTTVVSSGTAALHAAYAAIGLGPGDEIITPPITFVATQATAALLGATPVFVDVKADFPNIDSSQVERAITPRTKAIVAVDYAGQPAEIDELRTIADKHNLFLIEDAAHSIGSAYKGRPVGSLADITTFSFFPTKNLTTGEGGAISSKSPELLTKAREFSRQGMIRDRNRFKLAEIGSWHQEVHEFGLNYRLSDLGCALGLSQLQRLQEFKSKRNRVFEYYTEKLTVNTKIKLPKRNPNSDPMWHLFPIRVPANMRSEVFDSMRAAGIGVQVNYLPSYRHPVFGYNAEGKGLENSENFYSETLSLPMHVELGSEELELICSHLLKVMQ